MNIYSKTMNKAEFDLNITRAKRHGKLFAQMLNGLVHSAVVLYWGEGNRNIASINSVIEVGEICKGINVAKLQYFFKNCVPHQWNTESKRFGKLDKNTTVTREVAERFLAAWPEWSDSAKDKIDGKPFDLFAYLSQIQKKLGEAAQRGDFTADQIRTFKTTLAKYTTKLEDLLPVENLTLVDGTKDHKEPSTTELEASKPNLLEQQAA